MTAKDLVEKYIGFFEKLGHKKIPNSPLVPENDPTVLFTTAGMHPLISYLMGQPHPLGKRLVGLQKCLRTDDIDEVGDKVHHTFFEMLGNWSLGDYWKKEAIEYSYEFLTSKEWLGIDKNRIAISVFAGDNDAPFDQESYDKWIELGIPESRIKRLPKKDNWWGPAGETGPCGPDTEMFVWAGQGKIPQTFDPKNSDWVEVWNNVFMEYNKTRCNTFEPLKQKNVDTGMGLERMLAVLNNTDDDYKTELFLPAIKEIEKLSKFEYGDKSDNEYIREGKQCFVDVRKQFRIIADHLRAAVFIISNGVEPSNKEKGYIVRRIIRRSILQLKKLGIVDLEKAGKEIAEIFINLMSPVYPELKQQHTKMIQIIEAEIKKFNQALEKGLKEFNKLSSIDGKIAFDLFQTYGFPLELIQELAKEKELKFNPEEFKKEFEKHQKLSRTASTGMFKGGLGEQNEQTTKYHTATHLLHAALRKILGEHVQQKGSNITAERLRFDFSYEEKLTDEQIKKVEDLVNEKIKKNLPVTSAIMNKDEALKSGALGFFLEKYGDKVTVYTIDNPSTRSVRSGSPFSREICGGPHIDFTGKLKRFKIIKQENIGGGQRRIYAILDK
ncbi:MAG: alanine--tRNA ligase [Candidatus Levyibacteriota bacterium]